MALPRQEAGWAASEVVSSPALTPQAKECHGLSETGDPLEPTPNQPPSLHCRTLLPLRDTAKMMSTAARSTGRAAAVQARWNWVLVRPSAFSARSDRPLAAPNAATAAKAACPAEGWREDTGSGCWIRCAWEVQQRGRLAVQTPSIHPSLPSHLEPRVSGGVGRHCWWHAVHA